MRVKGRALTPRREPWEMSMRLAALVPSRKDANKDVRKAVDDALEKLSRSGEAAPR